MSLIFGLLIIGEGPAGAMTGRSFITWDMAGRSFRIFPLNREIFTSGEMP